MFWSDNPTILLMHTKLHQLQPVFPEQCVIHTCPVQARGIGRQFDCYISRVKECLPWNSQERLCLTSVALICMNGGGCMHHCKEHGRR